MQCAVEETRKRQWPNKVKEGIDYKMFVPDLHTCAVAHACFSYTTKESSKSILKLVISDESKID